MAETSGSHYQGPADDPPALFSRASPAETVQLDRDPAAWLPAARARIDWHFAGTSDQALFV
jgi:hypothetical protein